MDPKLVVVPFVGIMTFCSPPNAPSQTWSSLTESGVRVEWPEKRPERPEPDHPWDEDGSPIFVGNVLSSTNASARLVTTDSGTVGRTAYPVHWLENINLVMSPRNLEEIGRPRWTLSSEPTDLLVSPNAAKHLSNPSTAKVLASISRRRG
jgi:hypothetical protein